MSFIKQKSVKGPVSVADNALIEVDNLTLGYEGRILITGLSFSVFPGDYLCIIGENGCGKSTLIRTLLGLRQPQGGEASVRGGTDGSGIGYLPQQTEVQKDFPATAREIVLSGRQGRCGLRPFYNRADKAAAADAMERMGISALRARCFRELSGGQKQRVLLARALCAAESLLLLDEPVTGLDPAATEDMYSLIRKLNSENGISVIMITHDLTAAKRYANKILSLGDKQFFGSANDFFVATSPSSPSPSSPSPSSPSPSSPSPSSPSPSSPSEKSSVPPKGGDTE